MKDIDFDELDRAVASALGGNFSSNPATEESTSLAPVDMPAPSEEVSTEEAPAKPATSPSISAHNVHSRMMPGRSTISRSILSHKSNAPEQEEDSKPAEVQTRESEPAPLVEETPQVVPARRRTIPHRSGRFMDMMPAGSTPTKVKKQVSRVSRGVTPSLMTNETTEPETSTPENAPSTTHSSLDAAIDEMLLNEKGAAPAQSAEEVPKLAFPTPAMSAESEPPEETSEPIAEPTPQSYETDLTAASEIAKELEQPLTENASPSPSPFLSDAKVEKRPLGSAASETLEPTPAFDTASSSTTAIGSETAIMASNDLATPAELNDELLAIESRQIDSLEEEKPVVPVQPTAKGTKQPVKPAPVKSDHLLSATATASAAAGPTSIARQYKEAPRVASEDDESGKIFDPETYHTALEHPAKKSSGWGWVIAILGIVLLGAVVAVVLWMEGVLPTPL